MSFSLSMFKVHLLSINDFKMFTRLALYGSRLEYIRPMGSRFHNSDKNLEVVVDLHFTDQLSVVKVK